MNNKEIMKRILKKERDALSKLKMQISKRYKLLWMKLFGSKVREDFTEESDVDVVIVLENEVNWAIEKDIYELCFYIELEHDILIFPMIFSKREISNKLIKATPFFKIVKEEGIFI